MTPKGANFLFFALCFNRSQQTARHSARLAAVKTRLNAMATLRRLEDAQCVYAALAEDMHEDGVDAAVSQASALDSSSAAHQCCCHITRQGGVDEPLNSMCSRLSGSAQTQYGCSEAKSQNELH